MWDKAAAARYENWYSSPRGSFALAREQRLMAHMVSVWHRRNHTLLEVGCGTGHFLKMFYDGGFGVTGIDQSEAMLEKARERLGNRVTLRLGNAEHLPFDDCEFDFVALVTSLECMADPEAALAEAFRVASRGVLITYINSWSIYRMEQGATWAWNDFRDRAAKRKAECADTQAVEPHRKSTLQQAQWFNLVSICRMIRKVSGRYPNAFRSTLFLPSFLWRGAKPFSLSWAQLFPFGAVSVVRVDLVPLCATTITLRSNQLSRTAQMHAGAVTMEQYPKTRRDHE